MAYVGNNLTVQQYAPQIAYFNGNGSTVAFTLPIAVVSAAQIIVAIENVIQNPSSSYSVSGTTLTFTSAPPSGTNNIWVEYTSLQTNTVAPSAGTVGQAQMSSPTGTGFPVLQTSPTLITPALGTPSAINLANATGLGYAAMPTGSVLQVVQTTYTAGFSTTSTSFVATGFSVAITPKFSTSKVLIIGSLGDIRNSVGSASVATLYRGATNLGTAQGFIYTQSSGGLYLNPASISYLDSPATTSATTYQIYLYTGAGTAYINDQAGLLSLIAMEIAG